ncbi:MAG: hypothetical protein WCO82_12440 [Sphingomonadales bacterium]
MMRMVFIAALSASPAMADAVTEFRAGNWPAVVKEGRAENTADSLILAGRAELWIAGYQTRDKAQALTVIAAAEKDCDAALARKPGNAEAQMQKAVAIAYRAQLGKNISLAKDVRRRFEALRTANPNDPLPWGALGGWHGGAVATVGSFLAGAVLGAKKSEMERCYAQALKLAPNLPSNRVFFAITLLDLDAANATRAAALLKGVEAMPASDGFEANMRAQGVQLAAALAKGNAAAAQAQARRFKAFAQLG